MPYVYFVQPREMVGTMHYKIGMSELDNLSRARSYGNGTRYLCIIECANARDVERHLIRAFHQRFTCVRGNEYFEIDSEPMTLTFFIETVMLHKNDQQAPVGDAWMRKFAFKIAST